MEKEEMLEKINKDLLVAYTNLSFNEIVFEKKDTYQVISIILNLIKYCKKINKKNIRDLKRTTFLRKIVDYPFYNESKDIISFASNSYIEINSLLDTLFSKIQEAYEDEKTPVHDLFLYCAYVFYIQENIANYFYEQDEIIVKYLNGITFIPNSELSDISIKKDLKDITEEISILQKKH